MVSLRKTNVSLGELRLSSLLRAPQLKPRRTRGKGHVVGVDVQPGYVAAAAARQNGRLLVERAAVAPLDAETVREGEVINVDGLAATLRELFDRAGLDRKIRLGVANQRTVMRMLEVPPFSDRHELEAAVRFQAEDQLPMPLASAAIDFRPLGVVDTPAGARQRVLLVAAQLETVQRLLAAVRAAGLQPQGVDLAGFALVRALFHRAEAAPDGTPQRLALLNVGGLSNLVISDGLECRFTRVLSRGLEAIAAEIAERRAVPIVQARELLFGVGVGEPQPAGPAAATPAAPSLSMLGVEQPVQDVEALAIQVERERQANQEAIAARQAAEELGMEAPVGEYGMPAPGGVEGVFPDQPTAEATPPAEPAPPDPYATEPPAALDPAAAQGAQPVDLQPPSETTVVGNTAIAAVGEPAAAQNPPPAQPAPVAPEVAETMVLVEAGVRSIAGELRNTLDFFAAQETGPPITEVVLSGPALDVPGFAVLLERYLGLPVRPERVESSGEEAFGAVSANYFAIAAGLAVEEVLR